VAYALTVPFTFYALSRGYVAQIVQDLVFILLPAFLTLLIHRRSVTRLRSGVL
jgi:hypothetical protein